MVWSWPRAQVHSVIVSVVLRWSRPRWWTSKNWSLVEQLGSVHYPVVGRIMTHPHVLLGSEGEPPCCLVVASTPLRQPDYRTTLQRFEAVNCRFAGGPFVAGGSQPWKLDIPWIVGSMLSTATMQDAKLRRVFFWVCGHSTWSSWYQLWRHCLRTKYHCSYSYPCIVRICIL